MDTEESPPAALIETHISVVVFVGDRVYKLKKHVRFDFLDFSTLELRERACHREVEANRRIAPDVYLGVAQVRDPDGAVIDHLVVMRRMPPDRCLATLVRDGDASVPDQLRLLARLVASFHSRARTGPDVDTAATRDAVAANWEDGFAELAPFVGSVLDPEVEERVAQLVRAYLTGREVLFAQRIAAGRVCDGHGDLQAADVFCLDDGPRVLDCIEFDDRLRHGDVLADVAFLAMDLERLGDEGAAHDFLGHYCEFSDDNPPTTLLHHYIAYRAHVRAKVATLRAAQEPSGSTALARDVAEAGRLLDLARRHLEAARVRLVLVGGAPGTGKSTLARGIGDRLGATVVRSDEVRKERAGLGSTESAAAGLHEGLYDPEVTDATYAAVFERARSLVSRGEPVVIDASFTSEAHREAARELARNTSTEIVELRCHLAPEVAAERVAARLATGGDASDASVEVAAALAASADPWPEATEVSTEDEPATALEGAMRALDAAGR